MFNLLIVGAGCTGREVFQYARDCIGDGQEFNISGFIDINPHALDGFDIDTKIIGDDSYTPKKDDAFVITMGDPKLRLKMSNIISNNGGRLVSIIHPSAYVAPDARIGKGCIIAPLSFVAVNTIVEDNVLINVNSVVGHDAKIGSHSAISPGAVAGGGVTIESGVFIGSNAVVVPGCKVGRGSKIAAGSVVYRDIDENNMALGNPAKARPLVNL